MRKIIREVLERTELVLCEEFGLTFIDFGVIEPKVNAIENESSGHMVIEISSINGLDLDDMVWRDFHYACSVGYKCRYGWLDDLYIHLEEGEKEEILNYVREHKMPLFYGHVDFIDQGNHSSKSQLYLVPNVALNNRDYLLSALIKYRMEHGVYYEKVGDIFKGLVRPPYELEDLGEIDFDGCFTLEDVLRGFAAFLIYEEGKDKNGTLKKNYISLANTIESNAHSFEAGVDVTFFLKWLLGQDENILPRETSWCSRESISHLYELFKNDKKKMFRERWLRRRPGT